jgi:hypothetical protein
MNIPRTATFALVVAGLLGSASSADAAEIRILVERLNLTTGAVTGSLLARDQPAAQNDDDLAMESVRVTDTSLASAFPELDVGSFVTASSNRNDPTVFDFRTLSFDTLFVVKATAGATTYRYRVTVAEDNFFVPSPDDKFASSTATARFTNAGTTNQTRYQGWVDPNNTMAISATGVLSAFGAISPGLHGPWNSTSPSIPNSISTDNGPVAFTEDVPYSLAAQITTTIRRSARVQSGGDLTVSSVIIPEPTSTLLFGTGLIGIAAIIRRRR